MISQEPFLCSVRSLSEPPQQLHLVAVDANGLETVCATDLSMCNNNTAGRAIVTQILALDNREFRRQFFAVYNKMISTVRACVSQ